MTNETKDLVQEALDMCDLLKAEVPEEQKEPALAWLRRISGRYAAYAVRDYLNEILPATKPQYAAYAIQAHLNEELGPKPWELTDKE